MSYLPSQSQFIATGYYSRNIRRKISPAQIACTDDELSEAGTNSNDDSDGSDAEEEDRRHEGINSGTNAVTGKRSLSTDIHTKSGSKKKPIKWSRDMDEILLDAVRKNPTKFWKDIAQATNMDFVSCDQCRHRYGVLRQHYLSLVSSGPKLAAQAQMTWLSELADFPMTSSSGVQPSITNLSNQHSGSQSNLDALSTAGSATSDENTTDPWAPEEENILMEFADSNIRTTAEGLKKIDWSNLIDRIGRTAVECQRKWSLIRQAGMRKGPFTEEEDRIIIQRVQEWREAGKGLGLWVALQEELGRSSNNCNHRWHRFLQQRVKGEDSGTAAKDDPLESQIDSSS